MNFGTDLLIVDGEIMWNGDDLATVSGVDNVNQQAYLATLTDLGENVFFSLYGGRLYEYAAKPFTMDNKQKMESEAREILMKVGTSGGGQSWIETILVCDVSLVQVDGKSAKMLYVKYLPRGSTQPQEINYTFRV